MDLSTSCSVCSRCHRVPLSRFIKGAVQIHVFLHTPVCVHTHILIKAGDCSGRSSEMKGEQTKQCGLHRSHRSAKREGERIAAGTTDDLYNLFFLPRGKMNSFYIYIYMYMYCYLNFLLILTAVCSGVIPAPASCSEVVTCLFPPFC